MYTYSSILTAIFLINLWLSGYLRVFLIFNMFLTPQNGPKLYRTLSDAISVSLVVRLNKSYKTSYEILIHSTCSAAVGKLFSPWATCNIRKSVTGAFDQQKLKRLNNKILLLFIKQYYLVKKDLKITAKLNLILPSYTYCYQSFSIT